MTKKHYKAVAAIIGAALPNGYDTAGPDVREVDAVRRIAHAMADYMASENPRFNRARFMAACGF